MIHIPITVKFGTMGDREFILEVAPRTRGFMKDRKPVMVYNDLPADLKRERGRLAQKAKKLQQEGKKTLTSKLSIIGDLCCAFLYS